MDFFESDFVGFFFKASPTDVYYPETASDELMVDDAIDIRHRRFDEYRRRLTSINRELLNIRGHCYPTILD